MSLLFVSSDQYPDKYAAPIRHSTFTRGLMEQGHQVNFLLLSTQNWNNDKTPYYFGIYFKTFNSYTGSNKIFKKIYELKVERPGLMKNRAAQYFYNFSNINSIHGKYLRSGLKRIGFGNASHSQNYLTRVIHYISCEAHVDIAAAELRSKLLKK